MDKGSNILGRIPPQSIEAEQSVLGSMMLDSESVSIALEILRTEDFYRNDHREIFDAMVYLFNEAKPVDLVTLCDVLRARGSLDAVGGIPYLAGMAQNIPTTANVKHYARIVEDKAILRKLIRTTAEISEMAFDAADEVSAVVDKAERGIFELLQRKSGKGVVHIRDVMISAIEKLEELYRLDGYITGVPTGFHELDMKLSGLQNSDLVLIAARPSMGKTAFALNIAQHAAKKKVPVAVFSLEMSKEQLVNRIICSEMMIENNKLRTGKLDDEDWGRVSAVLEPYGNAPLYIDDTAGASVVEIRAKCRRLKLEHNLGMVVIDYLQLMQGKGRSENRQQEISEISRSLKILAKDLNIPVVTLSQLSRAPEVRSDKRPMLSDLRESGAIEQDADVVMFLYRDDYYNKDSEKKNIAEVIIAKNRNGETAKVDLMWMGQYTRFFDISGMKEN